MTQQHDGPSLLPCAWLYESEAGDKELILDCNGEYARRLLEHGYTETPLFTRPTQPQAEGLDRRIEKQIWKAEANFDDNLKAVLEECRAALRSPEPSEEMVEKAWREGFQAARECLADDEAFTLTEDVEEDAWRDSTARAALSSLSLPDR